MYRKYPEREMLRSPFEGPGEAKVELEYTPAVSCTTCGYVWSPQVDKPKYCPDCNARIDWDGSEIDSPMSELYHQALSDGENGELTRFKEEPEADSPVNGTPDSDPSENETDKDGADENGVWTQ